MQVVRRSEAPTRVNPDGSRQWIAHAERVMMVSAEIAGGPKDRPNPPHAHPHEQIGYLEDAVISARGLCGLGEATVVRYKKRPGLFDILFGASAARRGGSLFDEFAPGAPQYLWSPGLPRALTTGGTALP